MRILVVSRIDEHAIQVLSHRHEVTCAFDLGVRDLRQAARDQDVLVFRSGVTVDAEVLEAAPRLGLLVRAGSGLDNVDVDACVRRGVTLVPIPEPGARAVAELTFALMLALSRHLREADLSMRQGRWLKHELEGRLIREKVLGIVGMGNIGGYVAELGMAWGMRVVGCVDRPGEMVATRLRCRGAEIVPIEDVMALGDYVTVHVPLTAATRDLVDADLIGLMKPDAYLLNLARGGVVDESALREALVEGRLAGAALDVHEKEGEGQHSPLADLPNVLLTPHIGAMASDAQADIGRRVVACIDAYERGDDQGSVRVCADAMTASVNGAGG